MQYIVVPTAAWWRLHLLLIVYTMQISATLPALGYVLCWTDVVLKSPPLPARSARFKLISLVADLVKSMEREFKLSTFSPVPIAS